MEIIMVNYGERQTLMKLLNVSYPTVKRALNGETMNKLALQIRELAIERGGRLVQDIPNKNNS